MSFVRFGIDGSQVYIYESAGAVKVCSGCALSEAGDNFGTVQLDRMLAHLAEHRDAGHVVPDWVDDALMDEWNE